VVGPSFRLQRSWSNYLSNQSHFNIYGGGAFAHLRIQEKKSRIWVWKENALTGKNEEVKLSQYLMPHQIRHMAESPGMIQQFIANKKHNSSSSNSDFTGNIHVLSTVSLNGQNPQPLVDFNIE
jgi:hypothetical protein